MLPRATIVNTTWRERVRIRCERMAVTLLRLAGVLRRIPLPPTAQLALVKLLVVAACAVSTVPPITFCLQDDLVGTFVALIATFASIYELLRLPSNQNLSFPGKVAAAFVLPLPFLGTIFYWVGSDRLGCPDDHDEGQALGSS